MSTVTIPQALEMALQHHRAGQLAEAEAIYRQILAVDPRHANVLSLLGMIAGQVGRHDLAVDLMSQAIALQPEHADFHFNLAVNLFSQKRKEEAIAAYRKAIQFRPDFAAAHNNLGHALKENGQFEEAIAECRRALHFQPDFVEALNNLGNALRETGRSEEAIACYRRTLLLRPGLAETCRNLGLALNDQGRLEEAMEAYRAALKFKPDYAEAHDSLGQALTMQGRLDEGLSEYHAAIRIRPDYAEAHSNLGSALAALGRLEEAVTEYRDAIQIRPDYVEAHGNLAAALIALGQLEEAGAACRRALQLQSGCAAAHNNLGRALAEQGRLDEAIAEYRKALQIRPDYPEAHSDLLLSLHYVPDFDAREIFEEHCRWDNFHARPLAESIRPHDNDRSPDRRLRIGYVSRDFREHSVACFIEGLLAGHDGGQVEVFCYADVLRPDAVTHRLQQRARWRNIVGRSDGEVAGLIREDRIDILVDLAGHTAHHRLLVFARKPAPVQVGFLGYPDTTGLRAMDFRLTDAYADPPGTTENLHTEKLIRLPNCAWCFRPSEHAPAVGGSPRLRSGRVTFGCFNTLPKITVPQLECWADILRKVPGSRLLLKNRSLQDASTRQRLQAIWEKAGIASDRLVMERHTPRLADHLAFYHRVDIALDTFPYHGTTTTCEALWMGVPVVTLSGSTHASRVGVSLLSTVGLPDLVARTPGDYVRRAVELASDSPRLDRLRATLRDQMKGSGLGDALGFTRDVEQAYRRMWLEWCAGEG